MSLGSALEVVRSPAARFGPKGKQQGSEGPSLTVSSLDLEFAQRPSAPQAFLPRASPQPQLLWLHPRPSEVMGVTVLPTGQGWTSVVVKLASAQPSFQAEDEGYLLGSE